MSINEEEQDNEKRNWCSTTSVLNYYVFENSWRGVGLTIGAKTMGHLVFLARQVNWLGLIWHPSTLRSNSLPPICMKGQITSCDSQYNDHYLLSKGNEKEKKKGRTHLHPS